MTSRDVSSARAMSPPGWLLLAAISLMAVAQLANGFQHLLFDSGERGAGDLARRYDEVQRWFAGAPVYPPLPDAVYPPATYAMLWPFIGWSQFATVRWIWAVLSALTLIWLSFGIARASERRSDVGRRFATVFPLAISAGGVAVGNGQFIQILLPMCVALVLLVRRTGMPWLMHAAVASLALVALAKPTLSAPFVVLSVLAGASPWWLGILVPSYAALTLVAASFQPTPLFDLLRQWLARGTDVASSGGYGDLHLWFADAGLSQWILPATVLVLVGFSAWVYCYRTADTWLLLGVAGVVARLWAYHRSYDDLLILLPALALLRISLSMDRPRWEVNCSRFLVGVTIVVLIAPSRLQEFPPPIDAMYASSQVVTWFAGLAFLLYEAHVTARHPSSQRPAARISVPV